MQKFTRALTREIEVGGKRLAVTFDAEGVTLRPVGSRRPPLKADWAAVVAALTGTEDLRDALEALEDGAKKPAARPLAALDGAGAFSSILARLDAWLKEHRKRYHKGLLPGASAEELATLAKVLGRPVPDEVKTWLTWHNGQGEELTGSFIESFSLMSVADIVEALKERHEQPDWNPAFLPILDDFQDDLLVLDTSQSGLPVREVWRGRDDHPEAATSFAGWLERLLEDFEAGKYVEDSERGEYMRTRTS